MATDDTDVNGKRFTKAVRGTVFSPTSITLLLDIVPGGMAQPVAVPGPVTYGHVADTIKLFYKQPIPEGVYARLQKDRHARETLLDGASTSGALQALMTTYKRMADLLNDHQFLEGLEFTTNRDTYRVSNWGS